MNDEIRACRRYQVSGKVQGVYFRASAREAARGLSLSGWVRNLADGRVEAVAAGAPQALAEFERWLAKGPPRAEVSAVVSETWQEDVAAGFEVL
ncbi:MAG: acylphosphatase [Gammaproteobacteria bacterium]